MSLINDALRRAKQQTVQAAPAPNLQLRPATPTEAPRHHSGIMFSLVFVAIAIVAGAIVPMISNQVPQRGTELSAKATETFAPAADVAIRESIAPLAQSASVAVHDAAVSEPAREVVTAAPVVDEPAVPPSLKLQGILFGVSQPSAIINGKTVYVGNRVGAFRVAAIGENSAMLINGSQTNILSFED